MTGSPKELAERLKVCVKEVRALRDYKPAGIGFGSVAEVMREAAAKLVEMEAALKPFAEIGDCDPTDLHTHEPLEADRPLMVSWVGGYNIAENLTFADFAAASRALSQKDEAT